MKVVGQQVELELVMLDNWNLYSDSQMDYLWRLAGIDCSWVGNSCFGVLVGEIDLIGCFDSLKMVAVEVDWCRVAAGMVDLGGNFEAGYIDR